MLTRSYCLRAFPALQQLILNRINDIVTLGVGLAESGVAIGQALGTILPTLGTAIGQVLDGEFVPAFNTVTDALRDAAVGIATPTLTAIIDRRTRAREVSAALQTAVPLAIVQFGNGVLSAINGVIVALLAGGEGMLDALLPPDLGALLDAVVDGAQGLGQSLADGTQDLIDGTAAQQTIAIALGTEPPAAPLAFQRQDGFSASVGQVQGPERWQRDHARDGFAGSGDRARRPAQGPRPRRPQGGTHSGQSVGCAFPHAASDGGSGYLAGRHAYGRK